MPISKETKDLSETLFVYTMALTYAKLAKEMPSATECAEWCKNIAIEHDKYWEDIEVSEEEPPNGDDALRRLRETEENIRLYLPGGVPPKDEKELVELFRRMSEDYFGFSNCVTRDRFPDCTATKTDGEPIRIEFEFNSVDFALHRHDHNECDAIVCWEHSWSSVPDGIEIVELRKLFGFGFNVWFQGATGQYAERIAKEDSSGLWSVASRASEGDLLLFYRTKPEGFMADIFVVNGPVERIDEADWKKGKDWMAPIRRVCKLENPLLWKTMKSDPRLADSPFVKMQMQGRPCASDYWGVLYELIVSDNPDNPDLALLAHYGPHKIGAG